MEITQRMQFDYRIDYPNSPCPICKSKEVQSQGYYDDDHQTWRTMDCMDCGAQWDEVLTFTAITNLKSGSKTPPFLTDATVERLARTFSGILAHDFTKEQMLEMIAKNKTNDPDCCASHDYCDANMTMDDAFRIVMGRSAVPNLLDESPEADADLNLWNHAWNMAKANDFYYNPDDHG